MSTFIKISLKIFLKESYLIIINYLHVTGGPIFHHCLGQWRRAVTVSQHALRAALHIVNIDFELN